MINNDLIDDNICLNRIRIYDNNINLNNTNETINTNYIYENNAKYNIILKLINNSHNNSHQNDNNVIVYWISRELRTENNWSLIWAKYLAQKTNSTLICVYFLQDNYYAKNNRNYSFLTDGLIELQSNLNQQNIPFNLIDGTEKNLLEYINYLSPKAIIHDFYPLKDKIKSKNIILNSLLNKENNPTLNIEVDAHNIVPVWIASPKQEFGAYTIRPKIKKLLNEYLIDISRFESANSTSQINQNLDLSKNQIDNSAIIQKNKPNDSLTKSLLIAGEKAANLHFENFKLNKLKLYDTLRNEPSKEGQSGLSPYLNYGFISNQKVAYQITQLDVPSTMQNDKDAFLEEHIIRRELSDNCTNYNPNYDNFNGFHIWAQTTLNQHKDDKREYIYTKEQFENAQTYDNAWNAAQMQLVKTGKLHGYMRMYWAKKILEWSESPETALEIAIYLNDYYALDGRDPNGFVGIAWSIGGLHDRAWTERPVFGKIRFMNYNGLKRKFDIEAYINQYLSKSTKPFL